MYIELYTEDLKRLYLILLAYVNYLEHGVFRQGWSGSEIHIISQ